MAHLDVRTTVDATATGAGVLWAYLDPTSAGGWIVAVGCGVAVVLQRLGSWWLDYSRKKNQVDAEQRRDENAGEAEHFRIMEDLDRESNVRKLTEALAQLADAQVHESELSAHAAVLERERAQAIQEAARAQAKLTEFAQKIANAALISLRKDSYFGPELGSDDECPIVPTP